MIEELNIFQNYIFDMDGTLIDSSVEVLNCLKEACHLASAKINESHFNADVIGPPLREIIKIIIEDCENENLISAVESEFRRIYDFDENDQSQMYDGAYEWLVQLKKTGKKLFLATNKPTIPTKRLIKKFNLDMFDEFYTIDKYAGKSISKNEMIEEILAKYNLDKSETVMIGDAPSDIKAGQANDVKTIGVLWGYGKEKEYLKQNANFLLKDLKELTLEYKKNELLMPYKNLLATMKEVYIFATKDLGRELAKRLSDRGYKIIGFIDNNLQISGEKIDGIEIFSLPQIQDKNATIIIGSLNFMFEIETQLAKEGFRNVIPFSIMTLYFSELANYNQAYDGLYKDYIDNNHEYKLSYSLFEDEESIKTLDALIEYRRTYDTNLFNRVAKEPKFQYFENFIPNNFDVFVDGGGFDGDTVIKFIQFSKAYSKIYMLEPDELSLNKAKTNLKGIRNVEFLPFGVSNCSKTLKFDAGGKLGSALSESGNIEIKCVSLDDCIKEKKAFIKLDIEGAEIDAINGAKRLISNNSLLAICVYHKPSDIWKIPQLILSINKNYKFFLRHYSNSIFETVLYGVPLYD